MRYRSVRSVKTVVLLPLNTFSPMKRMHLVLLAGILLAVGCKKEEMKEYTVNLEARCWDCIVQYAAGPDRGRRDTLLGSVEGTDTLLETGHYNLIVKENDNIFFRACRIRPDTAFGDITLQAGGGIQALSATVGTDQDCATINQVVQVKQ